MKHAHDCQNSRHLCRTVFGVPRAQDGCCERFFNIAVDIHGGVEITDSDGITLPPKVLWDHRKAFATARGMPSEENGLATPGAGRQ